MRVLHLISSGGMYGAEAVILQLCREMPEGGFGESVLGVFAIAGQPEPQLHQVATQSGVHSETIPCRGQLDLSVVSRLRQLAEESTPDVVHAHGYKADVYTFLAFRGANRPVLVSTCHTWYDNDLAVRLYGALDRWVLQRFDEVIAVSTEVRNRLLSAGVAAGRIHLIRNGVSVADERSGFKPGVHSGGEGRLRVGLVGRLAREKGIDVFLHAIAKLKQTEQSVEFLVAGDGPDRGALEELVRKLGLEDRVRLLGQQADMPAFYRSLDILVSASRQEGLPMALLEGMASGLPVVATRVGEVPRVVVHGETGVLVEPESAGQLAAAMEQVLASPELRRSFGEAGQERVRHQFSAKRMTREYAAVYRRALRRQRRPAPEIALPMPGRVP